MHVVVGLAEGQGGQVEVEAATAPVGRGDATGGLTVHVTRAVAGQGGGREEVSPGL